MAKDPPLPPEILADAYQDRITPASGRLIVSRSVIRRIRNEKRLLKLGFEPVSEKQKVINMGFPGLADLKEKMGDFDDEPAGNLTWHESPKDAKLSIEGKLYILRTALEDIAAPGQYYAEEFPDSPLSWHWRYDCVHCDAYAEEVEELDTKHKEHCPIRIAREALAEIIENG